MSDRHVIPEAGGWHVERDFSQRISAVTVARPEAIRRAADFVAREGGGRVLVHGTDGSLLETRTIPGHGATPTAVTSIPHPRETGHDEEPDGDHGQSTATSLRRPPGGAENTAPIRRAGRAAAREADRRRRGAGASLDVVATATVDDGPGTAVDRAGRRVHQLTERVAKPLDEITELLVVGIVQVGRLVNPLRITGRVLETVVTTGLRIASAVVEPERGRRPPVVSDLRATGAHDRDHRDGR